MPVIYAASGNCHVYVDAAADLDQAREIVLNAKVAATGRLQRRRDAARAPRRRRRRSCPPRSRALARRRRRAARRRARARAGAGAVAVAAGERRRLGHRVPRADARGRCRRLARGRDRAHRGPRHRPHRGDRDARPRAPRSASSSTSTPPASTSTPRRASPTAASSGWARRSATRRRSCTRAGRSGCASSAPASTWSRATGTFVVDGGVGILGGTFNPPHLAHLVCASEARAQLGLDRVVLVPTARPAAQGDGATSPGADASPADVPAGRRAGTTTGSRCQRDRGRARRPVVHGRYA